MQDLICEPPSNDPPCATRRLWRKASPTEMAYIATRMLVVSRSVIEGTVTRAQFERAVAGLEARYGILRSVVVDGQFIERDADTRAVQSWLDAEPWSADAMFALLLNAELDTRKRIYSIHVIASRDALDVFFLSSHAITDATSLVELHACLAHLCDCIVRDVDPMLDAQPFPDPVDAAVERSQAALTTGAATHAASWSGDYAEIPMPAPRADGSFRRRLTRMAIGANDLQRIRLAAHTHGSSIHSLLLAAFALAIAEVAENRPRRILMRSAIDMRRRLEPHVSAELVFSAITGHITPIDNLDPSLFEIAKVIFDDIHAGVANGLIFQDYLNYAKAFGSKQQAPVALSVSDMQTIEFRWPVQRLKVRHFEYAAGWLKRFPNVSVSVFDGTLIANVVYVEDFVDPATMRAICESAACRLVSACRA
jgi:hypothetical protein